MFMFLSSCDPETQKKILENWNNMRKSYDEKIKEEKRKAEEKENDDKIIKFKRENPPVSFKDMIVYSQLLQKYGDRLYA